MQWTVWPRVGYRRKSLSFHQVQWMSLQSPEIYHRSGAHCMLTNLAQPPAPAANGWSQDTSALSFWDDKSSPHQTWYIAPPANKSEKDRRKRQKTQTSFGPEWKVSVRILKTIKSLCFRHSRSGLVKLQERWQRESDGGLSNELNNRFEIEHRPVFQQIWCKNNVHCIYFRKFLNAETSNLLAIYRKSRVGNCQILELPKISSSLLFAGLRRKMGNCCQGGPGMRPVNDICHFPFQDCLGLTPTCSSITVTTPNTSTGVGNKS